MIMMARALAPRLCCFVALVHTARASALTAPAPAATCPAPPAGFTFAADSCISGTKCTAAHCNCDNRQLSRGTCATVAGCVSQAAKSCAADAACHAFAVQARENCSDGKASQYETYRFGGAGSAVPNTSWQAYWRPGTAPGPPPPSPRPHPPPHPPPPAWPSIPAHGAGLPTLISGNWTSATDPLPDPKIPANPLVGNGYTGIIVDGSNDFVALSINTNSMWTVRPASGEWPAPGTGSTGSQGHVPTAHRCALGGLTFWSTAANFSQFGATQRIANATLTTVQKSAAGVLTTETVLHPQLQVTTTTLRWSGSTPLELNVSTWAAGASTRGSGSGAAAHQRQHPQALYNSNAACCDGRGAPARCPTSGGGGGGTLHCVARNASQDPSPKQIWAALATRIIGGGGGGPTRVAHDVPNNGSSMWGGSGQVVSAVTTTVTLSGGQSLSTVTALSDSFFNSTATASRGGAGLSPLPAAAALATATTPLQIANATASSWAAFWETSSVSTPTLPALEWCWYGSLYMTKGFASTDPSVPPSGLYGPWVSSTKKPSSPSLRFTVTSSLPRPVLSVVVVRTPSRTWVPSIRISSLP